LRDLLEAFESLSTEVVGEHRGRVVKTIGDEVLFVADSAADAGLIALDLLDAAESDNLLPALRIGVAAGPVVSRLGDVYGSTVNIASRLTSIARPGTILVDRVMADSLAEDGRFALRQRRPESVRGYHHLRQWRLRRAGHGDGPGLPGE
jgi:adenylate cyclase